MRLWARFLRWCHLMRSIPGWFSGDVHQAITYLGPCGWEARWYLKRTICVECTCGRKW